MDAHTNAHTNPHTNPHQNAHQNARRQVERDLRRWLRGHFSVISLDEAFRLGATMDVVRYKLDSAEWERMHRGVYR
ncbi:MAG: hypothetical protein QOE15_268, partial [Acidimicrobiaceae bacterium]|nr:hypothetical protein [Acidimicrobiaceae bacterium]